MQLLDYRKPKARRGFRIAAAVALVLGLCCLFAGHLLTLQAIAAGQGFKDAAHPFFVPAHYYVPFGLGLARNLTLILGAVLTVSAVVVLGHRELRWWFWDRYLEKK